MPRSYWRIALVLAGLAIIGLLATGYLLLENAENQPYPREQYQPARDANILKPARAPTVPTRPYEPNCRAPQSRDDADLCAQWGAVQAATEGNRLTRIDLRVTYFEFAALVISLVFTGWAAMAAAKAAGIAEESTRGAERALDMAAKSAAAAEKQVAISEDTARRQLRAYLTFNEIIINFPKGDWKIQVAWRNGGQTPAYHVLAYVDWIELEGPLPEDFRFTPQYPLNEDGTAAVGPGERALAVSENPFSKELIQSAIEKIRNVYVWGAADYVDAFGLPRRTEIAMKVIIERTTDDGAFAMRFRSINRHNNMDDECMHIPIGKQHRS